MVHRVIEPRRISERLNPDVSYRHAYEYLGRQKYYSLRMPVRNALVALGLPVGNEIIDSVLDVAKVEIVHDNPPVTTENVRRWYMKSLGS